MKSSSLGFTVVELLIITGIMAVTMTLAVMSLVNSQQKSSMRSAVMALSTNIKDQQLKAILADRGDQATPSAFGVYFDQDRYILFQGEVYNPASASNVIVPLEQNLRFSPAGRTIVFSLLTGQLPQATSQAVLDITNNSTKTIFLNKYGVVTQIQ